MTFVLPIIAAVLITNAPKWALFSWSGATNVHFWRQTNSVPVEYRFASGTNKVAISNISDVASFSLAYSSDGSGTVGVWYPSNYCDLVTQSSGDLKSWRNEATNSVDATNAVRTFRLQIISRDSTGGFVKQ